MESENGKYDALDLEHKNELLCDDDKKIYPCDDCGKLRSKNEGGTTFTVCDECWDKHFDDKTRLVKKVKQ